MTQPTAIVVGGGLSGLAAAHHLQKGGVAVTVLERSDRPGGRARTERRGGYIIDTGPDALTGGYKEYLHLVEELGLGGQVVDSSGVLGLVRSGGVIDIDPAKPLAAAMIPALSVWGKLRLARGLVRLRRKFEALDSFELAQAGAEDRADFTAEDYAVRYFGREATDYLIDPVVRLTAGSGAAQASYLGVLGALASWTAPLQNIRGGLDVLPHALAKNLSVTYDAEVSHVREEPGGVSVTYVSNGLETHLKADYCVLGSMHHVNRKIWPPLEKIAPEFSAKLTDLSLISISLGYKKLSPSKSYVILVPTKEQPDVLLGFQQHNKAPDRAPPGHSLITLYTDGLSTPAFMAKSDAEIEAWACGVVEGLFPSLRGAHDLTEITRWPHAGYLATPGYWGRSLALLRAVPKAGRVRLAGDLFGGGSMESAVRWGRRAAEAILEKC